MELLLLVEFIPEEVSAPWLVNEHKRSISFIRVDEIVKHSIVTELQFRDDLVLRYF